MKIKIYPFCFLALALFFSLTTSAQPPAAGDYRSAATGDWTDPAIWETYNGTAWIPASAAPSSTDGVITILSGHSVSINGPVTTDQTIVDAGGSLLVNVFSSVDGGNDLTIADGTGTDLIVNGTLFLGTFNVITGAGDILVNGTMTWTSGTLDAVTAIGSAGVANLSGDFTKNLNANLTNNGTFNSATGTSLG